MELVNKQMEMEKIKTAHIQQKYQLEIDILNLQKEEVPLKIDLFKKNY